MLAVLSIRAYVRASDAVIEKTTRPDSILQLILFFWLSFVELDDITKLVFGIGKVSKVSIPRMVMAYIHVVVAGVVVVGRDV